MRVLLDGDYPLGEVSVDSGQLFITDPCYVKVALAPADAVVNLDREPTTPYERICRVTLNGDCKHPLFGGEVEDGVAFSTQVGDGAYPVVAHYERGQLRSVEIIIAEDPDEDEEPEDEDEEDS